MPWSRSLIRVTALLWTWSILLSSSWGQTTQQAPAANEQSAQPSNEFRYGEHPRNRLDFFPAKSELPTSVLIFFHGGGFVKGDKEHTYRSPLVKKCLDNGISFVTANYRFVAGPDSEPFPGSLMDGVRVVQFVRSKASDWNLDPERIVLSGSSAGAFMSLWIALHDEFADPGSDDPVTRQSSRVSGVVAYSGPTTIDPHLILEKVGGNPEIHSALLPIFDIESIEELYQPGMREKINEFSPLNHVTRDDPPLQLRYLGTLSDAPLPADAPTAISIHHAKFGEILRDRYKQSGNKQSVELVCEDCPDPNATEVDFLQRALDLKR